MTGFEAYVKFLALRRHFTDHNYDFHKYNGKVKASEEKYRKDRKIYYFFERLVLTRKEEIIVEFLLSSFIMSKNPSKVWIQDLISSSELKYSEYRLLKDNLSKIIEDDFNLIISFCVTHEIDFNDLFYTDGKKHPPIIKLFLSDKISIETVIVIDKIIHFTENLDKKLTDSVWKSVLFGIQKYKPFLKIDLNFYKNLLRDKVYVIYGISNSS
jgi:hypothetical protein